MLNPDHVPAHPVEVVRNKRTFVDRMGGVFADSPRLRPINEAAKRRGAGRFVYEFGPKREEGREVVYTCPVSVIPLWAWDLFDLWWQCRMLGGLPVAGGVLDQPVSVRASFPVFEAEHRAREASNGRDAAAFGTAAAIARVFGGGVAK